MNKNIERMHAIAHGRVQGVFFREKTCREARKLGLTGWVKNLPDGTVETEFQGGEPEVKKLLEWLSEGSPMSYVSRVVTKKMDPVSGESDFDIAW